MPGKPYLIYNFCMFSLLISPPSDVQPRAVATSESLNEENGRGNSSGICLQFPKRGPVQTGYTPPADRRGAGRSPRPFQMGPKFLENGTRNLAMGPYVGKGTHILRWDPSRACWSLASLLMAGHG